MTLTISEGRQVVDAVRKHGVIFQTGSHRRSDGRVRNACELVRNGRIGELKRIRTTVGTNNKTGAVSVETRFEGSEGWISVGQDSVQASSASMLGSRIGPDEIHLYRCDDHYRNFLECIKNVRNPSAPAEISHRSATICHMGNIAMTLKKKLRWNPDHERFVNDKTANTMLSKPMRTPWRLQARNMNGCFFGSKENKLK